MWLLANKKEGSAYKIINGIVMGRLASACWFTNIDHGKRHEFLMLATMAHNLKYNKKLTKKFLSEYGVAEYPHYDNYDAIEVPFTECIPSDYDGVMGVPITFLDKYNPEQFEIIGATESEGRGFSNGLWHGKTSQATINCERIYKRLFIKYKKDREAQ